MDPQGRRKRRRPQRRFIVVVEEDRLRVGVTEGDETGVTPKGNSQKNIIFKYFIGLHCSS